MKIKFLILSIMMLFALCGLQANPVTKEKAAKVAVNFYYQAINQQQSINFNSIKITNMLTTAEKGLTYYYIFNIENGGFVIVSAEDSRNPIIGYSFDKNYSEENPSPELTWWMSSYKEQIKYNVENKVTPDQKIMDQWNEYSNYKPYSKNPLNTIVGPYLLTTWDQSFPYNELCPTNTHCAAGTGTGSGGHVWAGCVATAMGQILNYYKYPLTGTGTHTYTCNSALHGYFGSFTSNYADSTYNWNEMPNSITGSCIPIASLLYQLAISVNMTWGCDGSGAYSYNVPNALVSYFGYSNTTSIVTRHFYSQANWEALIQQQLNLKYPLYYSGTDSIAGTGHAFNLDGYQVVGPTTTYHFNWGWSGSGNGYFDINDLASGNGHYDWDHAMIINAYPATGYPYNCTGQKTLTAMNGVFEDGSGHMDYQPNLNCSWLINPTNPSGTDHISLKFDRFELTDANDIVTIYDGETTSAPVLRTFNGTTLPSIGTIYNSTANKVLVTFTTDGTTNGGGWNISYSAVGLTHCSGNFTLLNSNYTLNDGSGPQYNYSNGVNCRWIVKPDNATYIKLKFNELETELNKDVVKIYRGTSPSADSLLGAYSGSMIPADTIVCPSGKMLILFTTDGIRTYQGWTVTWKSNGTSQGIEENNVVNNISIFPNPAENNVKINFTVNTLQNIQLKIVDVVGKIVYSEKTDNFVGYYNKSLDLSKFSKGIYIVHIMANNSSYNQKLIVK